jgi:predicted kinase
MATVHLVYGYLGAGKTTFARCLEDQTDAVRFSADEWYLRLFTDGATTAHLDPARWDRMMALLDELWPSLLTRGVDVVLDFGFWSRASRDRARALAKAADAVIRLYEVTCREDIARARCLDRNPQPGVSFEIGPAAFEDLKAKLEPLGEDEEHHTIDTSA